MEKRRADEMEEDLNSEDEVSLPPAKRREIAPAATITTIPPPFPSDLTLDHCGPMTNVEICNLLMASRILQRLSIPPSENSSWPTLGDKRLGGDFWYKNRQRHWDGNDQIISKRSHNTPHQASPPPPVAILPSFREIVQAPPSTGYERLPITPSPRQSPYQSSPFLPPFDWQRRGSYISPPMSLRESFSIQRERQDSVFTTDECHTPVKEHYGGPLFPTPQPEAR